MVTVVIPTYNRYELLKRALTSVYAQTYAPREIIVIDDGSTDNTSQIQEQFPEIKYFYQENSGVSSARNLGIKNATSKWIAFLDSDDEWHKNKLQLQVKFHQENSDILISYTDERWIRDEIEINLPKKYKKHGGDIFDKCLSHCIIAPSAALIHQNIFEKIGLFDENLEVCEDYDLWLRISQNNQIGLIDKKLITKYAGHQDQLSFKYWGMDRFRVQSLENLFNLTQLDNKKNTLTLQTIIYKYTLLLKGAKKHNRILEVDNYTKKIEYYEHLTLYHTIV